MTGKDDNLTKLRNAAAIELQTDVERLRFVFALYLRVAVAPVVWGLVAFAALEVLTSISAGGYDKALVPARLIVSLPLGAFCWAFWTTREGMLAGRG